MKYAVLVTFVTLTLILTPWHRTMADPQGAYHTYNGVTYYVTQFTPGMREIALGMNRSKYLSMSKSQKDKLKATLVRNYVEATGWHGEVILNIGDENGDDLDYLEVDRP